MKRRLFYEIYEIFQAWFSIIPGTLGKYSRQLMYKLVLKKCDAKLNVGMRVKLQVPRNIDIGENVSINYGVWMASNYNENGSIKIGNDVLIGPYTIIHSGNHNYKNPNTTIYKQGFEFKKIIIEDDVWIAARCTILSGVTIGKGSVIAAGSVVTKDVLPYTIMAGVPAKEIGKRA